MTRFQFCVIQNYRVEQKQNNTVLNKNHISFLCGKRESQYLTPAPSRKGKNYLNINCLPKLKGSIIPVDVNVRIEVDVGQDVFMHVLGIDEAIIRITKITIKLICLIMYFIYHQLSIGKYWNIWIIK